MHCLLKVYDKNDERIFEETDDELLEEDEFVELCEEFGMTNLLSSTNEEEFDEVPESDIEDVCIYCIDNEIGSDDLREELEHIIVHPERYSQPYPLTLIRWL